jgi:hypothetical protein
MGEEGKILGVSIRKHLEGEPGGRDGKKRMNAQWTDFGLPSSKVCSAKGERELDALKGNPISHVSIGLET